MAHVSLHYGVFKDRMQFYITPGHLTTLEDRSGEEILPSTDWMVFGQATKLHTASCFYFQIAPSVGVPIWHPNREPPQHHLATDSLCSELQIARGPLQDGHVLASPPQIRKDGSARGRRSRVNG